MIQTPQRPHTTPPWTCRKVLSAWWVSARVNGVLVPVAAFTFEQDARAVVALVNGVDSGEAEEQGETSETRAVLPAGSLDPRKDKFHE